MLNYHNFFYMKRVINIIILLLITFTSLHSLAQDIHLQSKLEEIEIKEDSSFVRKVTVQFKKSDMPQYYPIFYDTELEKISDINIFSKKGKRFKRLSIKEIHEEDVNLDYIASKKVKTIMIPKDAEVMLTYLVSCKELIYFSSLEFFSYNDIDTLKYQIKIPKKFELAHNTIYKDSLSFYAIDSIKTDTGALWDIKVSPKKITPSPLRFLGIYKNIKVPLMQTLVIPSSYKDKPINYMNDWYFKSTAPTKQLNASAKQKINELTNGVTDPLKIINIIYSYVKNNFKYVAIEIGMGAFIPSHVNEVYLNKQGDCKDLSNFLSEALKYKGIRSDIALAATFDHISDCTFPSLSAANHVIGVAYVKDKVILLDPTDPIHLEGTPVESLQGRTILIINEKGGEFYNVNRFDPEQNEIVYRLSLIEKVSGMLLKGEFNVVYNGISSNYLKRSLRNEGKEKFENLIKIFYKEIFKNQLVSKLTMKNELEKIYFEGDILIDGKIFNDGLKKYLFIDFLPKLIETENREVLTDGTYLGVPFHKKVYTKIKLDSPIEIFKPIIHTLDGEGVSLKITIRALSSLEIECNYDFVLDYIYVENENIDKINETLMFFKKIVNEPVPFQKQKK